jgi:hypothetical protein
VSITDPPLDEPMPITLGHALKGFRLESDRGCGASSGVMKGEARTGWFGICMEGDDATGRYSSRLMKV